jgi:DNA-binding transcriptional regulator YhcF (GntR family)
MHTLKIKPKSACPLYGQLYKQLRQLILEQKLPGGAPVHGEITELAKIGRFFGF